MLKLRYRLILIFSCFSLISCDEPPQESIEVAKPVKVIVLTDKENVIHRVFPGKVEPGKQVILSFQVSGKLETLEVIKGQEIKQGDLIAKLDPTDFELKVNEAKARRNQAQLEFNRAEALVKKEVVSQSEYEKKKAALDIAEANLKLAEQNLNYTTIIAPFDGRISDTYVDNFQSIAAKEEIAKLHNLSELDITIDVPEQLMIQIKQTEIVKNVVEFDAAPGREFELKYKKHEAQADEATQAYRVYLTMKRPEDLSILPGMSASVKIDFIFKNQAQNEHHFAIPLTSVFADENGKKYVWKVIPSSQQLAPIEVVTGELLDDKIMIKSGLSVGDQIVTAGVHLLRDKQLVKPMTSEYGK